jgi:hypothetical protein
MNSQSEQLELQPRKIRGRRPRRAALGCNTNPDVKQISLKFEYETFRAISKLAFAEGVSFAQQVRLLVERGMENAA